MTQARATQSKMFLIGTFVVFAVLAFIGTKVIVVPIPGTGGYFNLGDTFVMLSALLFGPIVGLLTGAFGPAAADAIGYLPYAPATFFIKGLEGLVVGLIGFRQSSARVILALVVGTSVIVIGYFFVQAWLYIELGQRFEFFNITTVGGAITELPFNILQGLLSGLIAYGVWVAFGKGSSDQGS